DRVVLAASHLPVLEVASSGLARGAVFGLLALGLVLIYRTTGVTNFAHWGVGLLGLVVYFSLTDKTPIATPLAAGLAILFCGAVGAASYRFVFRFVQRGSQ